MSGLTRKKVAGSSTVTVPVAQRGPKWWAQEDWLTVWLGGACLLLVVFGWRPPAPVFKWVGGAGAAFSAGNLKASLLLAAVMFALALPGALLLGVRPVRFLCGFGAVYAVAWLSQWLAGNGVMAYWGIEYVIFALGAGLLISNVFGAPGWITEAARTEYFIKTGIVIMGATILFGDVLQAGFRGMLQALLVVSVVWGFSFRLAKRLKLDDEFAAMLSTAVSICGVSAAIAACGAIQGDRRRLSYIASVVLIVAVPMIVLMPWAVKAFHIPDEVGGAWLGGTLDTTGSVVAAGALISERAMKTGTIVKFSQNVLIGVAAFLLSLWWAMKGGPNGSQRPSARVIWERFPKFVLGFFTASLAFSFLVDPQTLKATKEPLNALRTAWFAMAFASIGLETRFTSLLTMEGGRPLLAFLGAQAANVVWTLILAFLIFG
jgi:uncharacterized integral membrane protein (TIGR00698 family)